MQRFNVLAALVLLAFVGSPAFAQSNASTFDGPLAFRVGEHFCNRLAS